MASLASSYVGARVKIVADDGSFEGTIQALDKISKRITLTKVVSCKTGKKLTGLHNFYGNELEKVTVLEEKLKVADSLADDPRDSKIMMKKLSPRHLNRIKDLDMENLCLNSSKLLNDEEDGILYNAHKSESSKDTSVPEGSSTATRRNARRPKYFILIDSIDDNFTAAIKYLSQENIIGMAAEGVNMGRNGELCLLQFASQRHVFIFDMLVLGEGAFKAGLTELLQCPRILKIIHNCRLVSDLLFHQFGVKLVNIFDTQVADAFIYKSYHNGDLPRYVSGLPHCLFQYLKLSPGEVFIKRIRQHQRNEDESVWKLRPLPSRLLDCATKNVVYLCELRAVLMEHLMIEFTTGVDIYLSVIRDSDAEEINKAKNASHLLPLPFKNIGHILQSDDIPRMYENGFAENCWGTVDPLVVFSKSGIFHTNPNSTAAGIEPFGKIIFYQGSFSSSGIPEPPAGKADTSGGDSGSLSEGEVEKPSPPRMKPRTRFTNDPSPSMPKRENRSPHGLGLAVNAKLSPHQVIGEDNEDDNEDDSLKKPEITELTHMAQRLAAMSATARKPSPLLETSSLLTTHISPQVEKPMPDPANLPQHSSKVPVGKQEGPTVSQNQDTTSTGLNYVFRPAGEIDVPVPRRKTRGAACSGYDTDSGVSEGEAPFPTKLRAKTSVTTCRSLTTEDYGAIPDTNHGIPRRSLLSSKNYLHDGTEVSSDDGQRDSGEPSGGSDTTNLVMQLQQMVGLKKGLRTPGLGHSAVDSNGPVENRGRGYMLRPHFSD